MLVEIPGLNQGTVLTQVLGRFEVEEPGTITPLHRSDAMAPIDAVYPHASASGIRQPHSEAIPLGLHAGHVAPHVQR